jgi:hypothetical protein
MPAPMMTTLGGSAPAREIAFETGRVIDAVSVVIVG